MPLPSQKAGGQGRPTNADIEAVRERIETLYLNGMRSTAIVSALAAPENTRPIVLSRKAVDMHLKAIKAKWATAAGPDSVEAHRQELIALASERERQASRMAQRYSDSNLGVGYLNASLKAQERRAKLLGLDITRTELTGRNGGPIEVEPNWDDDLEPAERARRLRLEADGLELHASMQAAKDAR